MNPVKWLTVEELAKELNIPVTWIYQRTRLGKEAIPHMRMGKYVRFNIDEVVEFFKLQAGKMP